jgi:GR25 family glycosyltransferase involved in LPS biosynthesis
MSSNSCLDYIDAILYINLKHRKDRNEHILNEIKKIDPTLSKVYRIDAIYDKNNGALGCSSSHIKALKYFSENNSWNNCIIFEDDFTFIDNKEEINDSIIYLIENLPNFDVILLGIGNHNLELVSTPYPDIKKVLSSQTTSGYILNQKYLNTILNNYEESTNYIKKFGMKNEWCLDQYWKKLMPHGNWYTHKNRLGYQYNNYSDIEKKIVDYKC